MATTARPHLGPGAADGLAGCELRRTASFGETEDGELLWWITLKSFDW